MDRVPTKREFWEGYIQAIRRAKNYIYIENQFFVSSSHTSGYPGDEHETKDAINPVAEELVARIVRAIENNENFHVFIVLPMYPETAWHESVGKAIGSKDFAQPVFRTLQYMFFRNRGEAAKNRRDIRKLSVRVLFGQGRGSRK